MPTFRISYNVAWQQERKEIIWTAEPDKATMLSLAQWIMKTEFPNQLYLIEKGMMEVLRNHGITDIRSPVPID